MNSKTFNSRLEQTILLDVYTLTTIFTSDINIYYVCEREGDRLSSFKKLIDWKVFFSRLRNFGFRQK